MGFDGLHAEIQDRTCGLVGMTFRNQLNNVLLPRGKYGARSLPDGQIATKQFLQRGAGKIRLVDEQ